MPIYEYRCQDCNTKFEKLVRRSDDAASLVCPNCGQNHLNTELSTFAAHSRGTQQSAAMPSCGQAGMCPNAGMCGRN
jgi:putative FmdB family regulatory protein